MGERRYQEVCPRNQVMALPPCLDDYVSESNPARAIDAFVGTLDLEELGFQHSEASSGPGQPAFDPAVLPSCICMAIRTASAQFAAARSRDSVQHGSDLAVPGSVSELQDHRGFSQEQRRGATGMQPGVRVACPGAVASGRQSGGH